MSATPSAGLIDRVVRPHVAAVEELYLGGKNALGTTETYIPTQMPNGVARVVTGILSLFEARNMREHCLSMPLLAKDVVWDAPGFLLSRKGSVRVSAYLSKFIVHQRFVPSLVQVEARGYNRHVVDVSGTLQLLPHRTIFLPATLLLPQAIPIRATITIGVNGNLDNGMVELVAVKFHNLPDLPSFARAANGMAFGVLPHVLEPLWSFLPEFIGDDFYARKREQTFAARHPNSQLPLLDAAKDVVTDTTTGLMDYGVDSVHNAWDAATYLAGNFMEAVGYGVGRARAYTSTAAEVASSAAATTYNTASNIAGNVYNTAANVSSAAADMAAGTAGMAYNAAANTANQAYNTAASAAEETYEVGRGTVQAGKETVGTVVDNGVRHAEQATDEARRGYEMGKAKPVNVQTTTRITRAPAGTAS